MNTNGQAAERKRNPEDGDVRVGGEGRAQHGNAQQHADGQQNLAYLRRIKAALDKPVYQPATDEDIGNSGDDPGNDGVPTTLQDAHMQLGLQVGREPEQQQVGRLR